MAIDLKAATKTLKPSDLVGTWRGGGQETLSTDGTIVKPRGPSHPAYLIYTAGGEVMVLSTGAHGVGAKELDQLSEQEQARLTQTTVAYYGTFEITEGVIQHRLIAGLVPIWAGQSRTRYAVLTGDDLVFTTPPDKAGHVSRIFWQRFKPSR